MANIEIITSQNVSIEYELASLKDRVLAYIIDILIMMGCIFVLMIFYFILTGGSGEQYFLYIFAIPIFLFYTLLFEIFNNGKSLGKAVMKIKVVKINGLEPNLNDYLTRWAFRMVDIYLSIGSVAAFLVSSSGKHQRMGDLVADTTVIRYRADYNFNLDEILKRTSVENFQPLYPGVRKFTEEDMLLVKNTIERYNTYPNNAHIEALYMLIDKIRKELNLKELPKNKIEFLKTVLKEYVILTR